MMLANSVELPGQPCNRRSARASVRGDRRWKKCSSWPSMGVVNCGIALSRASCTRQSNVCRQWPASSRPYATGMPERQSSGSDGSGHDVASSRSWRRSSRASGTWSVNGVMGACVVVMARTLSVSADTSGPRTRIARVLRGCDTVPRHPPHPRHPRHPRHRPHRAAVRRQIDRIALHKESIYARRIQDDRILTAAIRHAINFKGST